MGDFAKVPDLGEREIGEVAAKLMMEWIERHRCEFPLNFVPRKC